MVIGDIDMTDALVASYATLILLRGTTSQPGCDLDIVSIPELPPFSLCLLIFQIILHG